jgi:hypothetical protein
LAFKPKWYPLDPSFWSDPKLEALPILAQWLLFQFVNLSWSKTEDCKLPYDLNYLRSQLHWQRTVRIATNNHNSLSHYINLLIASSFLTVDPTLSPPLLFSPYHVTLRQAYNQKSKNNADAAIARWEAKGRGQAAKRPLTGRGEAVDRPLENQQTIENKEAENKNAPRMLCDRDRDIEITPSISPSFRSKPKKIDRSKSDLQVGSTGEEDFGWLCEKCDAWRFGLLGKCKYCDSPMPENATHYVKHWCSACTCWELYECPASNRGELSPSSRGEIEI